MSTGTAKADIVVSDAKIKSTIDRIPDAAQATFSICHMSPNGAFSSTPLHGDLLAKHFSILSDSHNGELCRNPIFLQKYGCAVYALSEPESRS